MYVDDIVLANNGTVEITSVKAFLDAQFKIKDIDSLRYFLGFEIARSPKGIFLDQRKYTLELLEDSGTLVAKTSSTSYEPTLKLHDSDSPLLGDASEFRRLIGRLLYLTTHDLTSP